MPEEEGIGCSSDSELFERPWSQSTKLVRGLSKENLTVDVASTVTRIDGDVGLKGVSNVGSALSGMIPNSHGSRFNEFTLPTLEELGTPSAPPIAGIGRENKLDLEGKPWTDYDGEPQDEFIAEAKQAEPDVIFNKIGISADRKTPEQKTNEQPPRMFRRGLKSSFVEEKEDFLTYYSSSSSDEDTYYSSNSSYEEEENFLLLVQAAKAHGCRITGMLDSDDSESDDSDNAEADSDEKDEDSSDYVSRTLTPTGSPTSTSMTSDATSRRRRRNLSGAKMITDARKVKCAKTDTSSNPIADPSSTRSG